MNNLAPPHDAVASGTHQIQTALRPTLGDYRHNTDIPHKRRDTATKRIDKLVEDHLTSPSDADTLHRLKTEAPKHLERLQRASPMRHALVVTQLHLIVSQAAAIGAAGSTPVPNAPKNFGAQQNKMRTTLKNTGLLEAPRVASIDSQPRSRSRLGTS